MGIEEDFYATLKLKNGEEIFAKVAPSEEEDRTLLIVSNPIVISEVKSRTGAINGYKLEPWLKTTSDDMFILNVDDILTMSESSDIEMISLYQSYIRKADSYYGSNQSKLDRKMGYLASVSDAKEILEKIYKSN